jgi:Flp pilus assembly protein TadD
MSANPQTKPAQATGGQVGDRQQKLNGIRRMIQDGAIDIAHRALDFELGKLPKDSDFWALKSLAFQNSNKFEDAYAAMAKAAEFNPGALPLRLELARLANMRGNDADEVKALTGALPLGPVPEKLLLRLIHLHTTRQETTEALAIADRLVAAQPGNETFVLKRAAVLADAGRLDDARVALEALLEREDASDAAISSWAALVAEKIGNVPLVVDRLKELEKKGSKRWTVYACLAKALSKEDLMKEAIEYFAKALEIDPAQPSLWNDMGVLQRQVGLIEESQASINKSLELDPKNASALRVAGYEHKYAYGDEAWKRVNIALANVDKKPKNQQVEIHYAAAKALEDVGELEAAFAQYAHAGRLQKEITPWADTRMRGVLALMKNYLKPEDFAAVRAQATPSDKPVFVFGMPRSGTTLLEQVLASHPDVFGAGELKLGAGVLNGIQIGRARLETMYDGNVSSSLADGEKLTIPQRGQKYIEVIERIAGKEPKRVVDKMPGNYNWVGLLDAVIPGSHFIHSRRHPVEICLSEYRIFFPDGINFSYDLRDLGKAYRLYNDYMKYWSGMLGDKILHVRYEDMVADLETQARRIISFIGLPWNDACLKFYESDRKVVTASVSQVRKPIYTTSTNRWRKYEQFLKPLLEELGPLVKEYEDELAQADAQRQATAQK